MKESMSRFSSFKVDSLAAARAADDSDCKHHWVIESPRGPVSVGTCKNCSQEREFWNSLPNTGWERRTEKAK